MKSAFKILSWIIFLSFPGANLYAFIEFLLGALVGFMFLPMLFGGGTGSSNYSTCSGGMQGPYQHVSPSYGPSQMCNPAYAPNAPQNLPSFHFQTSPSTCGSAQGCSNATQGNYYYPPASSSCASGVCPNQSLQQQPYYHYPQQAQNAVRGSSLSSSRASSNQSSLEPQRNPAISPEESEDGPSEDDGSSDSSQGSSLDQVSENEPQVQQQQQEAKAKPEETTKKVASQSLATLQKIQKHQDGEVKPCPECLVKADKEAEEKAKAKAKEIEEEKLKKKKEEKEKSKGELPDSIIVGRGLSGEHEASEENLKIIFKKYKNVLVMASQSFCGPCKTLKAMGGELDQLKARLPKGVAIVVLEVDQQSYPYFGRTFGDNGTPEFYGFNGHKDASGKPIFSNLGFNSQGIQAFYQNVAPTLQQ